MTLHIFHCTLQQSYVAIYKIYILYSSSQQPSGITPIYDAWDAGCHVDSLCVCHQKPLLHTALDKV